MFDKFKHFTKPYSHYISEGGSLPINVANDILMLAKPSSLTESIGSRSDYDKRVFLNNKDFDSFSDSIKDFLINITSENFYKDVEEYIGVNLRGSCLRAEVVCDIDGFFQVPHLDTTDKRITWLTYLGSVAENGDVGTDIYSDSNTFYKRAPWGFNNGLIFLPSNQSWHGFSKDNRIKGNRKVLIINYVDDWNDVHELYNN